MESVKKDIFAVGHISNDLNPYPHLGGGVSYTGVAVKRLGFNTHIITKCPPGHPYIKELEDYGIIVHRLPVRDPQYENKITSFTNIYDDQGNRQQTAPEIQENITVEDLKNFPDIPKDSVILVAAVAAEVDTKLFPILAVSNRLMVTPQGYFRDITPDGKVNRVPWTQIDALSHAHITILSDEDLTFGNQMDQTMLNQITAASQFTVLTKSTKGSDVYEKNKGLIAHADIFKLQQDEVKDLTGAGDTYAAGLIFWYEQTGNLKEAAVFASLYSASKIMALEGNGINSPSTLDTLQLLINKYPERYNQLLKDNEVNAFPIFGEGHNRLQEKK